jgi:phage replication-related protein YjqB (UPF0714/DUF867 family)
MKKISSFHARCAETAAGFDGLVRKAFGSQSTLRDRGEHCSLDPERLAALGRVPGSQIRVRRSAAEFALYTVSETRQELPDTTVRMAPAARQRLGTTDEFAATIDAQVPHPTFSDAEAQENSEFVERLDDDGCQRALVVLAPHGGAIERHTDGQAEHVASMLGSYGASVWRCKGFKAGGGAFDRWHITSSEIHEASFPLLRTISARGFAHAVSFHGFSGPGVLIGGAAPLPLKEEIQRALQGVLAGTGLEVRIAGSSEDYDGDNPRNIVNRLTAGGANGVQIEQSLDVRNGFWEPIAEAVAAVYSRNVCGMS